MKNIISRISFFFMCFFAFPVHSQDEQDRPSKPTDLQATPGDGQVTLRWNTPNDNGSPITHYEYRHRIDEDNASWDPDWTQIPDSDAQTTSYTRDELTNGTTYRFRVRAVNEVGKGRGALVLATPVQPNRPPELAGPNTALVDENSTDAVATYEATDPDDDELTWTLAGADASAFRLDHDASGTTSTLHFQEAPDFETQPTYAVDVVVTDDESLSATVSVSVTVSNVDEPGTVVLSTTQSRVDEPITATLTDPDDRVTNVLWTWLQDGTASEEAGTSEGLSSTFTPTQAMVGTRLQARAHYEDGQGIDKSAESAQTEPVIGRPSRPRSLSATPGDGQVTLRWNTPNDNGSPITHYKYRHRIDEDNTSWDPDWTQIPGSDAQTTSYTIDNLTNGTTYRFRVHAVNEVGEGRGALVLATPVQPNRPPELAGPSTALVDENSTDAVATYEATDPDDDELTWTLTGADASAFRLDHDATGTTSTLHFQDTPDFETQQTYAVDVVVTDDASLSATVAVEVTVVNVDELGTVVLSTTQSRVGEPITATLADPDDRVTNVLWIWLQDGTASEEVGTLEGLSSTFTATQVMAGTRLQARAYYEDGHGINKSAESAPTEPVIGRPSQPRSLSATPGDGQVTLSWDTPNDNGSPITHYEYRHRIDEDNASWEPDWTQIPSSDAQTTSYTIDNLTNGTTYKFRVRAVNAVGKGGAGRAAATLVQPNRPPELAGPSSASVDEHSTDAVATYEATDPDDDELTWTLAGADASAFQLQGSGTTSTLHFQEAPDFETQPTYAVDVVVADDESLSATVSVSVTVSNVDEPGTVVLSTTQPRVGEPITATLTDPDGRMTNVQWLSNYRRPLGPRQRGASSEGASRADQFSDTLRVTPKKRDVGRKLQMEAVYDDVHGANKSVLSVWTEPVIDRPDPPSLSAMSGSGQVTLSWSTPNDNGSPITHYEYRQRNDGTTWNPDWTQIAGSDAQTTRYPIDNLTNGTTYTFEVRAVNAVGAGEAAQVSVAPGFTVRNLSASAGDEQVVLRWEVPLSDGGAPITGYEYRYSSNSHDTWTESEPTWATVTDGASARSQTVASLTNGTEYTFEVRAVNAAGESPASSVSATPATAPEAVVNLEATPSNEQVVLRWEAPLSDGGAPITGYEYRYSSNSHDTWTASEPAWADVTAPPSARSQTVASLTNGTEYTFEVRAVNAVGASPASRGSATPATVPEAVVNFEATPSDEQIVLSWEVPLSDGGAPITHYQYRYSSNSHGTWTESEPAWADVTRGSSARSQTVSSLANDTEYTFEVRAVNAEGEGPASRVSATPAVSKPGPVRNLSASAGDRSVTLRWEVPLSNGGSPITRYEYRRDGESWATVSGGASARRKTVSSLTNGTTYTFYVRAVNSVGGGSSRSITATPVEPVIITPPPSCDLNLSATPGDSEVYLSWSTSHCRGITHYQLGDEKIYRTSKTVSGLTNGTEYTFTVCAHNGDESLGCGNASATPKRPCKLSLSTSSGDGQVALSWSTSGDCEPITGYKYQYYVSNSDPTDNFFGVSGTSKTVTGLTNGIEYTFEVCAYKDTEVLACGSASDTPKRLCELSLSASSGNGQASLSWNTNSGCDGEGITRYRYSWGQGGDSESGYTTRRSARVTGLTNCQIYSFVVRALDNTGSTVASDVDWGTPEHPGSVDLTTTSPQVGVSLTATLRESDGGVTGVSWSWNSWLTLSKSDSPSARNGSSSSTYTPTASDVGKGLLASVSYSDGCGSGTDRANSRLTSPVQAASAKPVSLHAMPDSVLAAVAAPNPFNPTTTIHVQLPASGPVSLTIYNIAGQVVRTLWDDHELKAGYHTIDWDGRDQQGHPVTSGVYLYQLRTSKQVLMNKMVLIR